MIDATIDDPMLGSHQLQLRFASIEHSSFADYHQKHAAGHSVAIITLKTNGDPADASLDFIETLSI